MLPIEADLCENKEDSNIDPDGTEKVFTKMKDIRDCIYHIDKAQDRYKEDYDRKIRGCSKKKCGRKKIQSGFVVFAANSRQVNIHIVSKS